MPFQFVHDMARRYMRIELRGFWTADELARFAAEAAAKLQRVAAAGVKPGDGCILVDAVEFPIQDKALTEALGGFLPIYAKVARRVAVVASDSILQQMQVKRVVGSHAAVFTDLAAAERWLFERD